MSAKKYTIVYKHHPRDGTKPTEIQLDMLLTNAIQDVLKMEKYHCKTLYVFQGWPKQEKIP